MDTMRRLPVLFLPLPPFSYSFSALGTGWQNIQQGSLASNLTEWGAENFGVEFAGCQQLVFDLCSWHSPRKTIIGLLLAC